MALGDETRQRLREKKAGMRSLLEGVADFLQQYAQDHAAWIDRTGEARRGIRAGVALRRGGFTLYLEHTVWYARFLEVGARPHGIEADVKKALHWPGASHPVKKVEHPGLRSRAALLPAVDANISDITRTILDYWGE
jgi:hypothetical protein